MRIVQPYARIGTPSTAPDLAALGFIEAAARISHRSEDRQTSETWETFLRRVVLERGDWSVVEHVSVSVEFLVDRGITHEIVRHRLFSFTQESTRFVNYAKMMPPSFIYPQTNVVCDQCAAGYEPWHHASGDWLHGSNSTCSYDGSWLDAINVCELSYKSLLIGGWRPQEARSVFPNALASKLLTTGNLRNWRHFFQMRTSREAHPQMRQVTVPLLTEFQTRFPILFEDIIPDEQQAKAIRKGR